MAKGAYIGVPTLSASLGDLEVGATVKLNVDGVATDFLVVHQGNPDSALYDASCDGTWLLTKDCYTSHGWAETNRAANYADSDIHPYLNGDFFNLLDSGIQSAIKQVKLPYTEKTYNSGEVKSLGSGIDTKVFLLAVAEVGATTDLAYFYTDGACLDYFAGTTTTDAKRKGYFTDSSGKTEAKSWWLRTPEASGQYYVGVVTTDGRCSNDWCNLGHYIRPAFIMPANTGVVDGFVDGSEAGYKPIARKVKKGYIGVPKAEYEPVFADNSWAQIIKACQKNEVPSTWAVGDSKTMNIGGTDYQIDIIGKNHDTYSDGSGIAPLTFQMHDSYATSYAMNSSNTNSGGWESTAIRTTRLPAILALMPSEVQAGIKEVNKLTGQGGTSSAVETTADKLFILSVNEIFGFEPSDVAKGEGTQYAYYADGNSTQKKQNGEYNYWWTRSPVSTNSSGFFQVRTDGDRVSTNYPSGTYGVAFAFCFGGTSEVDSVLGGYSVARKIKKAYIGIGGVARPCWSGGGKLEYYGTITGGDLTRGSDKIGGTSNNKYAIFGGGTNSSYGNRLEVYGYNENLTKTVATNLSNCSTEASMCTGSNGKYGIFAGGYQYYRGDKFYNTIDAYDETLTKATATLSTNINRHSGTNVGNYSVHLGGKTSSAQESGLVTAIDKSLTVQYLTQVTTGGYSSRESTNKYAMFGRNGYSTLYAYDDQLTQTVHESPINGAFNDSAAATGNAVVFIEQYSYGYSGNIACDNNFTFSTIAKPERNYSNQMGCSFGDFAMFVGGVNWSGSQGYNTTDSYAYDSSLVLTQIGSLKYTRAYGATKAVGNYAVVAGGIVDGADTGTTTEAYTIV